MLSRAETCAADDASAEHRHRLLEAMSHAVARKGYADTTIADIAAEARVSRRTFYEHFASKSDCLIALYEVASHQALSVLKAAVYAERDWNDRLEQSLAAYLGMLASNPVLLSTLFIAILGLGAEGLRARRRVNDALAAFILEVVNAPRAQVAGSCPPPLPRALAVGIVGGINELVLQEIEAGRADRLAELTPAAAALARAVIAGAR